MSKRRLPENEARIEQIKAHLRCVGDATLADLCKILPERLFVQRCTRDLTMPDGVTKYPCRESWGAVHDERNNTDTWHRPVVNTDINHLLIALERDGLVSRASGYPVRFTWVGEPDEAVVEHQLEAMWKMEAVDHDHE